MYWLTLYLNSNFINIAHLQLKAEVINNQKYFLRYT